MSYIFIPIAIAAATAAIAANAPARPAKAVPAAVASAGIPVRALDNAANGPFLARN